MAGERCGGDCRQVSDARIECVLVIRVSLIGLRTTLEAGELQTPAERDFCSMRTMV